MFYIGGQKVKHVMSPEGTFFAGRKAALESMEAKEGEYSQEDIEIMQSGLKVNFKQMESLHNINITYITVQLYYDILMD